MKNKHSKARENREELAPQLEISVLQKRANLCKAASCFTDEFVEAVRTHREKLGLTQEELVSTLQACGIQVSQSYISLLEAGQRKSPSVQLVVALAVVLDISLDKVVSDTHGGASA